MPTGLHLCIGLNRIDPAVYGDDGALRGCVPDANDMVALATRQGYLPVLGGILLDDQATMANVEAGIRAAAAQAMPGDVFFLTYSGHGTQVRDRVPIDEKSGKDQAWCCYDGLILDDVLAGYWSLFRPGVKIFMLSDSCHSGTMARLFARFDMDLPALEGYERQRVLPDTVGERAAAVGAVMPPAIRELGGTMPEIGASVLLMSGCQDWQVSLDGDGNGLFTENLKTAVGSARTYKDLFEMTRELVMTASRGDQVPNLFRIGAEDPDFLAAAPLALS